MGEVMIKKVLFHIVFLLFNLLVAYTQQIKITVKEAGTGASIPYANICSESILAQTKKYQITDKNGQVTMPLTEKTIVSISCLGFEHLIDTIAPGIKGKTYTLKLAYHELSTVVVTGQYKPVRADKSIYDIKLIGKDRIENKAAVNLADALSDELSVRLSNDPSTGTGINLQGISGENIKILIDGVPVIGRLDGNIDLTQINLDNISHIEVVEGPMSVVYGSNALGGVINIITDKSLAAKYKTSLDSYYESIGMYNVNFLTSFRYGNQNFEFNGGRNFFAGHSDNGSRSKEWKPKEQYNVGVKYYYTGNNTKIRFKSDFFRERLLNQNEPFTRNDTAWIKTMDNKDSLINISKFNANDTWFKTIRFNNSIELTQSLGENFNFKLLTAYSYYNREKLKYLVDLTDLSSRLTTSVSDHDTSTFGAFLARGVFNYFPSEGRLNLQAGFDFNYETTEGNRIEKKSEEIGDYAIFASAQWTPFEKLKIQPGFRAAYNTKYDAPLTPSVNLFYNPGEISIRASWARGFRSPSLKELFLYFFDSNHQIEGNEDLKAEQSHNFTLSANRALTYANSKVILDIKTYYNTIEDKISLVQANPDNPLHYRNENTGSFESIGVEFYGTAYYKSRIKMKAGVSRIGRKDEVYNKDNFIFSNSLNANTSINFLKNTMKLSVFYKFLGKYPVYLYNESDEIVLGHVNGYHNMDASLNKKILNNRLVFSVGIKNIFNNTEINGLGASSSSAHGSSDGVSSLVGWGRTYFASLKINIVKY